MMNTDKRPKYLNLVRIRLPVTGVISIAHRISGVLMFAAIPVMVYLLHLSAFTPQGFGEVMAFLGNPLVKLVILLLSWSLFHHLFAGIRYLLIDVDIGVEKQAARNGAWIVLLAGLLATLVVGVML